MALRALPAAVLVPLSAAGLTRFSAIAGKTYTLQYCDGLPGPASWFTLTNVPPQGSTQLLLIHDDSVIDGLERFYRVVTPAVPH